MAAACRVQCACNADMFVPRLLAAWTAKLRSTDDHTTTITSLSKSLLTRSKLVHNPYNCIKKTVKNIAKSVVCWCRENDKTTQSKWFVGKINPTDRCGTKKYEGLAKEMVQLSLF